MCNTVEKFVDIYRLSFLTGTDGTPECRDEVALPEYDEVAGFEMEIVGKRLAQGRKKCQRATAKAMSLSGRLRDMRFCTSVLAKTPQRAAIG